MDLIFRSLGIESVQSRRMNFSQDLRDVYLRYALDQLSPAERAEVDAALIRDDAFSAAFKEAEYDLLGGYSAGELPAELKARVEAALVRHSHLRQSLEMVRAWNFNSQRSKATDTSLEPATTLHTATVGEHVPDVLPAVNKLKRPRRSLLWWVTVLAPSMAAIVLVGMFVATNSRGRGPATVYTSSSQPPITEDARSSQSARVQIAVQPPAAQTAGAAPRSGSRTDALPMAVLLLPQTTRSGESLTLKIRRGEQHVEVQWPAPEVTASASRRGTRYLLELSNENERIALLPEEPRRIVAAGQQVVLFSVEVASLSSGSYVMRILPQAGRAPSDVAGKTDAASDAASMPLLEASVQVVRED